MPRKPKAETDRIVSLEGAAAAAAPAPVQKPGVSRAKAASGPSKAGATRRITTRWKASAVAQFSHEEVARLAYSYWEARGCQGGSPEEDWCHAEQELRQRGAAGC